MKSEKQWLEDNRHYATIEESKLTSIFYFTLIWNLFEKNCCNGNAQINIHAPKLAKSSAEKISAVLPSIWMHFQNRYIQNGETTASFDSFLFNTRDDKQMVKDSLLANEKASAQDKTEALLRIAFRLRNNLYHGKKDVDKLYEQNENFRQINLLLMALVDAK